MYSRERTKTDDNQDRERERTKQRSTSRDYQQRGRSTSNNSYDSKRRQYNSGGDNQRNGAIKQFGAKIEGQIIKGIGAVVHKEMGAKTGLTDAKEVVPGSQVPQLDYEDV